MGMVGNFTAVAADRLQELVADPAKAKDFLYAKDEAHKPQSLYVDKAWHGIHFLLCGEAWSSPEPLGWAVLGGKEIGGDVGYGPARLLLPEQVAAVAKALAAIDEAQFRSRYAPKAMAEAQVYPDIIWERDGEEALDYLAHYYAKMARFYREAAARGDGMLLWIS